MTQRHIHPAGAVSHDRGDAVGNSRTLARRLGWAAVCLTLTTAVSFTQILGPAAAQTPATVTVDIASGSLGTVLSRFAGTAGITMSFDPGLTAGRTSPGLRGQVSVAEGFARLLAGSGLTWRFVDTDTVILEREASAGTMQFSTLTVSGVAAGERALGPVQGIVATRSATGSKTDAALIEIPQTINVVTSAQVEAQGAQNITEALRYTPGVTAGFGDNDTRNDILQSRGFFARYNVDGSRLPYGPYSSAFLRIEPYGLERIEVLKGPASVLYGQNTPGGLINLVSKRPSETPVNEVLLQGGSHSRKQGAFDLTGPVDKDGRVLYRLTGLARDADGRIDHGEDRRLYLAPSLTLKPGANTTLTVMAHVQRDNTVSDYIPLPAAGTLYGNPNGTLPRERFAGEPGHDDYKRTQYSVGYAFEHRFDDAVVLRQNLKYNRVKSDAKASPGYALDTTSRLISRVASRGQGSAGTLTLDTGAEFKAQTGALHHTLLIGADYLRLNDRYRFASNLYSRPLDLYTPVYGQQIPTLIPRIDATQTREQIGVYLQDMVKLGQWALTLGARQDWADLKTTNNVTSRGVNQTDSAFTWRAGLAYLAENGLAPYASYATSFQPLDGTTFAGDSHKPMKGGQVEIGVKYQPPGLRSFAQISAYRLVQTNVLTPDPDPTHVGFSVQTGEARVHGIEVEGKASLGEGLDVIASYAYTDSEVTKATPGSPTASLLGKNLPMTARHQLSAWADYTISSGPLTGLGIGAGARHMAGGYGDAMNSLAIPATNLADRRYVSYCQGTLQCYYGQGRVVLATLRHRW